MGAKKSDKSLDKNVWQVYNALESAAKLVPRDSISYEIIHMARAFRELHEISQYYRTDVIIHDSEIHLIGAVIKNPGISVTGLAKNLGITKGAVSEMVAKLVKKGLVTKGSSPGNLAAVELAATPKGRLAHESHLYFHEIIDSMVRKELAGFSDEQVKMTRDFLKSVTEKFKILKSML